MSPIQPKDSEPQFSAQVAIAMLRLRVTLVTLRLLPAPVLLRWQGCLTVRLSGWAQNQWATVRGGNLLDGCSNECAH